MAKWDVEVGRAHGTTIDEAKTKVVAMLDEFKEKNPALVKSVQWNAAGTEATVKGKGFDGFFLVGDERVEGKVKLGLALRLLKSKVDSGLKKSLDRAFG